MNRRDVIVTIGRETGSGGRLIAKKVAEALGVKCYARELITKVASESGFDEGVIERMDEKPTNSLLYSLYMGVSSPFNFSGAAPAGELPLDHKIFLAQFDAIRKIAEEEKSVVFLGRCADYALSENPNLLSVFILADEEDRIRRVARRENIPAAKAKETCIKTDKKKMNYYNYYSDKKWAHSDTYDLCLNSSVFGIDGCVELILKAVDARLKKK